MSPPLSRHRVRTYTGHTHSDIFCCRLLEDLSGKAQGQPKGPAEGTISFSRAERKHELS